MVIDNRWKPLVEDNDFEGAKKLMLLGNCWKCLAITCVFNITPAKKIEMEDLSQRCCKSFISSCVN